MSYIEIENAEWAIENGTLIEDVEELISQFEGGYAVSVGAQGHIWIYDNAFDAATDTCGQHAQLVVTHCGDLYAQFDGGGYIGTEGPKAHELAEDLEDLLAIFKASAETGYVTISDEDMTNLPTFGGDDMDEEGVWSWDEERCLIGTYDKDMEIVARRSLAQIWEGASDDEHDGPFDAEYVEEYAWNGMNVHVTEEQAQKIVDAEKRWQALREAGEATQNEWHHLCMELSEQVHG